MTKYFRYRAVFSDCFITQSIWTEKLFTHGWRWTGMNSDKQAVGGSGFAGSESLALKQIKSETSSLLRRPRIKKYDPQDHLDWKPGGFVVSEEVVPAELIQEHNRLT